MPSSRDRYGFSSLPLAPPLAPPLPLLLHATPLTSIPTQFGPCSIWSCISEQWIDLRKRRCACVWHVCVVCMCVCVFVCVGVCIDQLHWLFHLFPSLPFLFLLLPLLLFLSLTSPSRGTVTPWDNNFWLDLDFLDVAKAAQLCSAYFTSMLYIEIWHGATRSGLRYLVFTFTLLCV